MVENFCIFHGLASTTKVLVFSKRFIRLVNKYYMNVTTVKVFPRISTRRNRESFPPQTIKNVKNPYGQHNGKLPVYN